MKMYKLKVLVSLATSAICVLGGVPVVLGRGQMGSFKLLMIVAQEGRRSSWMCSSVTEAAPLVTQFSRKLLNSVLLVSSVLLSLAL